MGQTNVQKTQQNIVELLRKVQEDNKEFFGQDHLKVAVMAFGKAQQGAINMLDKDGNVIVAQSDKFHNYIDEYRRALVQLTTDAPLPGNHIRNENKIAKDIIAKLDEIKAIANKEPCMQEVCNTPLKGKDPKQMVEYANRVFDKVDVIMDNRGLGQITTPAIDAAKPYRADLKELRTIANSMVTDTDKSIDHMQLLNEQMRKTFDNGAALKNAHPWSKSRVELAEFELDKLQKDIAQSSLRFTSLIDPTKQPKFAVIPAEQSPDKSPVQVAVAGAKKSASPAA